MIRILLGLIVIVALSFGSCEQEECTTTYTYRAFEPVYQTQEQLNEEIEFVSDRVLERPGKFFYYNDMILINERDHGVHIIDNSNINNPQKLGFITINGNLDISLSGDYIYADTWQNIIVINIADIQNPEVVHVINGVKDQYWELDQGLFVVDYVETIEERTVSCDEYEGAFFTLDDRLFVDVATSSTDLGIPVPERAGALDAHGGQGQAGSLTRMALFNDHFYYINSHTMHIFDVGDLSEPDKLNEVYMEWGIETIFPYRDNLFIGANNGMHIFDNSQPSDPRYLSTFAHANACDPVVVQDDLAYVTLRDGTDCQNFINELNVVDVSDLLRPELLASFPMHHPHGLSVRSDIMYLCEGDEGLKVYDISEPEEIGQRQIGGVKDYFAFDVISVTPDLLLMIGDDGFYQFDTDQPADPKLLSSIRSGE